MSYRLLIRPNAKSDIAAAKRWYNEQRAGLGLEFLESVSETLERLSHTPEMHAKVFLDARKSAVRRFPYIVYYRIRNDVVVILAVIHNRRDAHHWQSRV